MEKATITFADGSELIADENGNCVIFDEEPVFPSDLSVVTVRTENSTTVVNNAEIVECASVDGRFWYAFVETPPDELFKRRVQSNIQMIAEMTDVDLDATNPSSELSLKERINDLEIAICELLDSLA